MKQAARTIGRLNGLCTLVLLPALLFAQTHSRAHPRPSLTASLESSGSQYLLSLDNTSAQEFQGHARISLGQESDQREAGRLAIHLQPNESKSLLLSASASGSHYTLQIFDQRDTLIFYKVAPLRPAVDGTLNNLERVTLSATATVAPTTVSVKTPAPVTEAPPLAPEIQLKARLVAGAQDNDPFVLAFDITAAQTLLNANLELTIGKAKQSKPVNLNKQAVVEFKLPEFLETNQIGYKLTRKDGSVATEGTTNLDRLYADDHVTVADLRPDRVAYSPGESVRLTIALEGQSPHGFKLDVLARDFAGNTFFTNTAYGNPGESVKEKEFTFALPGEVKGPVIFEFKVYDSETGLLFDSGERELTIKESKG